MTQLQCTLQPFSLQSAPALRIDVTVQLLKHPDQDPELLLSYQIDTAAVLQMDEPSAEPKRCDGLWNHTCLEAFVRDPADEAYWEYNLSPSGDWNVYRLDGYRQGLRQESAYGTLPFKLKQSSGALLLELRCCLPPSLHRAAELQLGLCAVLQEHSGRLSYWALNHPASEPDFHDPRGWTLKL
ncbi:MAG: DOMON-like domain-containing protein [Prochlorococcaceae cyanobacterium]